jgi:hypothetical protein
MAMAALPDYKETVDRDSTITSRTEVPPREIEMNIKALILNGKVILCIAALGTAAGLSAVTPAAAVFSSEAAGWPVDAEWGDGGIATDHGGTALAAADAPVKGPEIVVTSGANNSSVPQGTE